MKRLFGFVLGKLGGVVQKYLVIALIATSASTALFAYLYKEALQDIARVEEQAKREIAEQANARLNAALTLQAEAHNRTLEEYKARMAAANAATVAAQERLVTATKRLSHFETERRADTSTEYAEWRGTKLPSSVTERLKGLANGTE